MVEQVEPEIDPFADDIDSIPAIDLGPCGADDQLSRVEVEITTDEASVNLAVVSALAKHPSLYQKGGVLVLVGEDDEGRPVIRPAPKAVVRHYISQVATFVQEVESKDAVVRKDAKTPSHAVDYAHDAGEWQGVRRLDSISSSPVILPSGEIVTADGYEPTTRTYVMLAAGLMVDVPERPTLADAQAAAGRLMDLVAEFPFAGEAHKSAWLAGLLTPLATTLYHGPAPMFVFDANSPGVGKGKLADIIGAVLTGGDLGITPYKGNDEEMAKEITTIALEGRKTVLFDNVAGKLGCPSLELALTTVRCRNRLLGVNKAFDGPLRTVWYATSNNAVIDSDMFRRVQLIRLVTQLEKPHERCGFRHEDIVRHVREHRGEYLSAAITILKGWVVAGRPQVKLPNFGSYEAWSGVVRQAIVWAGLEDPRESHAEMITAREESLSWVSAILDAIERMDTDGKGVTSAAITKRCKEGGFKEEWLVCLNDVLTVMCRKENWSDLGHRIRGFKDAVVNGRQLRQAETKRHGAVAWKVVKIGAETPMAKQSDSPLTITPTAADGWEDGLDERLKERGWTYADAAAWLSRTTGETYRPDGSTAGIIKAHRVMLLDHLAD